MTVSRGLKKLGMKKKLSQWIPHSLNSAQKEESTNLQYFTRKTQD